MRTAILLALVLLACGTARASEWVSVAKSVDSGEYLVDVSSIRHAKGIRRAWIKVVYAPHTLRGFGAHANKWQSYTVFRQAFNCAENTHSVGATTVYFDDGTKSALAGERYASPWEPVQPDTMESSEMQLICARKLK